MVIYIVKGVHGFTRQKADYIDACTEDADQKVTTGADADVAAGVECVLVLFNSYPWKYFEERYKKKGLTPLQRN